MNPRLLTLDTLDDRRELHGLLHRLPPRDRVRFLAEACRRCPPATAGRLPAPLVHQMQTTLEQAYRCERANDRLTNEVYGDLLVLANQWGADLGALALLLTEWVRRPAARVSSSACGSRSAAARTPCSTGSGRPVRS